MKPTAIFPLLLTAFLLMAFQNGPNEKLVRVYGVNGVGSVMLALNADATFHYLNQADPSNTIDVTGTWSSDSNHVYLSGFDTETKVPQRWKIDDEFSCLRSGMTNFQVIRICAEQRKS